MDSYVSTIMYNLFLKRISHVTELSAYHENLYSKSIITKKWINIRTDKSRIFVNFISMKRFIKIQANTNKYKYKYNI